MIGKQRKRKCKVCKEWFTPIYTTIQPVCGPKCAIEKGRQDRAKEMRADTKERKAKLKTRSDWLREAQAECNKWIRLRDKGKSCISCGNPPKKENAGHYLSRGARPELRFHPWNISLQCESCNSWKSGNQAEYRKHLIARIGQSAVDWLEGPESRKAQNWTIEDAKEIKAHYRALIKEWGNDS